MVMQNKLSGRQAEFRPCFGATFSPLEKREIAEAESGKIINTGERPGTPNSVFRVYLNSKEDTQPFREL